jgi:hypothetical protein
MAKEVQVIVCLNLALHSSSGGVGGGGFDVEEDLSIGKISSSHEK